MVKILVCDICLKQDKKFVEATRYVHIKGKLGLRIDLCEKHIKTIPKKTIELVKLIYSLDGMNITDKEAKTILA